MADNKNVSCGHSILLPLAVLVEGVLMLRMVFYTRAHDGLAKDGWDGAVPPSCCTYCLISRHCPEGSKPGCLVKRGDCQPSPTEAVGEVSAR